MERMFSMFNRDHLKKNSILQHLDMVEMLRSRHETWVSERLDPEILQAHYDILNLLEQTKNKYDELLKLYGRKGR